MEIKEWLISKKDYSERSALDVISRLKRVKKMLNIENIDENTINKLEKNSEFLRTFLFSKKSDENSC